MTVRASPPVLKPGLRLIIGLFLLAAVGTLAMLIPGMTTRPFTLSEASFTAVSALTVTGLSVIVPSSDLTLYGQILLLVLMHIGGVGYMTLAVTVFRLFGRSVSLEERLALKDSLGLVSPAGVLRLSGRITRTVLLIEFVGAVALWLHWRQSLPEGTAIFYGIFHSVAAFSNAGFDLFSGTSSQLSGVPRDTTSLIILGTLIFLGSIGIPVLFDLAGWWKTRQFSLHTKITVPLSITITLLGAIGFFISERLLGGILAEQGLGSSIVGALFQATSARSGGLVGVSNFGELHSATQLVMAGLMFVGGSPASMGGGITTGTFAILVLAMIAYARGRETPIFRGRSIPTEAVRKAGAILTISILVVGFSTWLIALTHPHALSIIGFEVVSAFATCGLTLGITEDLNTFGRIVIMAMMFWGRLGALTIFVAIAGIQRTGNIYYPEEKVLIG